MGARLRYHPREPEDDNGKSDLSPVGCACFRSANKLLIVKQLDTSRRAGIKHARHDRLDIVQPDGNDGIELSIHRREAVELERVAIPFHHHRLRSR